MCIVDTARTSLFVIAPAQLGLTTPYGSTDNQENILKGNRRPVGADGKYVGRRLCCQKRSYPLGSNCEIAGLLLIRRLLSIATGIWFLLLKMLWMGGTVAITTGLFLPAGFHAGIRSFRLHTKPSKIEILKRQAVRLYF